MLPCRFVFQTGPITPGDPLWPGFTLGTECNGWDDVSVTPDTLERIIAWCQDHSDLDTVDGFQMLEPSADGKISLHGYCTTIVFTYLN